MTRVGRGTTGLRRRLQMSEGRGRAQPRAVDNNEKPNQLQARVALQPVAPVGLIGWHVQRVSMIDA